MKGYYWKPESGEYAGKWFWRKTQNPEETWNGPYNSYRKAKQARAEFYDELFTRRKSIVIEFPIAPKQRICMEGTM